MTYKMAAALVVISICSAVGGWYVYEQYTHNKKVAHVHVHTDFLVVINDVVIDFSDSVYQSKGAEELHPDIHLHDNVGTVIHRHAEGVTFAEFLASLGYTLSENCLTDDIGGTFCESEGAVLTLYVNGTPFTDIMLYIPQEEDQVLLYYGEPNNPRLQGYFERITDDACIYSGTCRERGVAPPESCGLTCEA